MSLDRIVVGVEGPDPATNLAIVERARRRGFVRFVVPEPMSFPSPRSEEVYRRSGDRLVGPGPARRELSIHRVRGEADLDHALSSGGETTPIVLEFDGDRLIPLENAIARRGRGARPWVYVDAPREVPGALGALEHGAERVIARVHAPEEVDALEAAAESEGAVALEWRTVGLRAVRSGGVGDRVLVDTTSLLRPEEGLLVGSAAAFLFHVASEAVGSAFSRPRPFRVNAGAAHLYVLMADGTTRYLSELAAGDRVLAAVPKGPTRPVRVGRVKIERRPLIVLDADDDGSSRTVFLQEAETVRVSTDAGRRSTTEIGLPARVLGVGLPAARHLGHAVEETILER